MRYPTGLTVALSGDTLIVTSKASTEPSHVKKRVNAALSKDLLVISPDTDSDE
jgi:hypothetical protein